MCTCTKKDAFASNVMKTILQHCKQLSQPRNKHFPPEVFAAPATISLLPSPIATMQGHGGKYQGKGDGNQQRPEPTDSSSSSSNNPMDKFGCDYCGWWHPNSPFPIPSCFFCGETPSYHHGRCCPMKPPRRPNRECPWTPLFHSKPQPELKKLRRDLDHLIQRVEPLDHGTSACKR